MNGPEHYQEAERLLAEQKEIPLGPHIVEAERLIEAAQVHATLALAAATIDAERGRHMPGWQKVSA